MKRALLLGVLVGAGALTLTVSALSGAQQAAADQPMVVEVERLKDNLYMMRGGGGNSAVFITASGVTVVDTKNPGWGQPLLEKIKSVTDKPVTMIINDNQRRCIVTPPSCTRATGRPATAAPSARARSFRRPTHRRAIPRSMR